MPFLHDLEIVDSIDHCFGCKQGKAVGGTVVQPYSVDFDDVLAALGFAGQVETYGYRTANTSDNIAIRA